MSFQEKLDEISAKNNSLVCVGLDSDYDRLPASIKTEKNAQFVFNKAIVDATHNLVCAYKPNRAFYEAMGEDGVKQLKMTCDYIQATYPEIPIILDAKYADIGSTNDGYVRYVFNNLDVDAVTLHPYLGHEALSPFLEIADKGCIILCKTSNPGAGELQNLKVGDIPLYKVVAEHVINTWNEFGNCMMVIGATYPEELAEIRKLAGDMTFLVPGVGAQGGDVEKIVKAGLNSKKSGLIISSSRGIIFASGEKDFQARAKEETAKLRDEINKYR